MWLIIVEYDADFIMSECDLNLYSRVFKSPFLVVYTLCGNGSGEFTSTPWREFEGELGLINNSF